METKPAKKPITAQEIERMLIDMEIDVISTDAGIIKFWHKGNKIQYFIKKQWFSGKGIRDGRGLYNMLNQLQPKRQDNIIVVGGPVTFEATAGAGLKNSILEVLAFCETYKAEAKLKHNGIVHTITASTNPDLLEDNWTK